MRAASPCAFHPFSVSKGNRPTFQGWIRADEGGDWWATIAPAVAAFGKCGRWWFPSFFTFFQTGGNGWNHGKRWEGSDSKRMATFCGIMKKDSARGQQLLHWVGRFSLISSRCREATLRKFGHRCCAHPGFATVEEPVSSLHWTPEGVVHGLLFRRLQRVAGLRVPGGKFFCEKIDE